MWDCYFLIMKLVRYLRLYNFMNHNMLLPYYIIMAIPALTTLPERWGDLGGVHLRPGRVPGQLQADLVEAAVPGSHGNLMGISWTYHEDVEVSSSSWAYPSKMVGLFHGECNENGSGMVLPLWLRKPAYRFGRNFRGSHWNILYDMGIFWMTEVHGAVAVWKGRSWDVQGTVDMGVFEKGIYNYCIYMYIHIPINICVYIYII